MLLNGLSTLAGRRAAQQSGVLLLFMTMLPLGAQAGFLDDLKGIFSSDTSDTSSSKSSTATQSLSSAEIGKGLKEALTVGAGNVVSQLGQTNGFNNDPAIHIPLPKSLDSMKSMLDKVGMGQSLDDLELRMNRAAELATPRAKALFVSAIQDMTLDDVTGIYKGADDAATQYFKSKMSAPLATDMAPIVDDTLADAGASQVLSQVMGKYNALPFVPPIETNLTDYVVDESINGIFYYLAKEEAAIRQDPVKQTTALLKKVFGQ